LFTLPDLTSTLTETMTNPEAQTVAPHIPVLLTEVLAAVHAQNGETIVDGTFGAGGYTKGILTSANCHVVAIDRDPTAIANGQNMVAAFSPRLSLLQGTFDDMAQLLAQVDIAKVDAVVLDIGVSSMQIDDAERGFSFMRDGPLDMRMSLDGPSAADFVNHLPQEALANLIFVLGEEPRSRAIAKAIVRAREAAPLRTTFDLVKAVEAATGPQRAKDRTHPATRTFQALRIHVNGELEQLSNALIAAEHVLAEGGRLAVVTFHSLEDRIVKRFLAHRSGNVPGQSRHAIGVEAIVQPSFKLQQRGHVGPSEQEADINPRSRSAKLRWGIRTAASPMRHDEDFIGVPKWRERKH
jgi:16S rRNA (cytosine1402-N4)-methyltransferase